MWDVLYTFTEPLLVRWPFNKLREKALKLTMDHIHYEDENTLLRIQVKLTQKSQPIPLNQHHENSNQKLNHNTSQRNPKGGQRQTKTNLGDSC